MKQKILIALAFVFSSSFSFAQNADIVQRPKLVVGIVVDQMRWDYLYRFYNLYDENGGFKRMMHEGFSCDNTIIPYTPTVTAAGHTSIYTGSVPAIDGIVGNDWFDVLQKEFVYCCDDDSVETIGATDASGKMSPRRMLVTTIGDELRISNNFESKVIGISLKDRAAILPAGHSANAAYWYDPANGNFISSSYYMNDLPAWLKKFNGRKIVDSLYTQNWNLSLNESVYKQYAGEDEEAYEYTPLGSDQTHFPYKLNAFKQKDYSKIETTPSGNTLLELLAESTITNENLGKNTSTDFLTVSFSAPDHIGHAYGPDSWEQMDDYIKLDKVLGNFLNFLDAKLGKGNYTVFLTADHGAANSPGFSIKHNLPGGAFDETMFTNTANQLLKIKFNSEKLVLGLSENELFLNNELIDSLKLDRNSVVKTIISYCYTRPEIAQAFSTEDIANAPVTNEQKQMFQNGYFPNRSGSIQLVLKPGYVAGNGKGTSHGSWNPYDAHIPLLWYGWGIKHGSSSERTYMTDIAATLSALLHIQMPSGCIGLPIQAVMK